MEPIRTHIHVPEDQRVRLDLILPADIPTGPAEVTLLFASESETHDAGGVMAFAGSLSRDSVLARSDSVVIQRHLRDEWNGPAS